MPSDHGTRTSLPRLTDSCPTPMPSDHGTRMSLPRYTDSCPTPMGYSDHGTRMSLSRLTDTRSRTVAHGQLLHAMGYSEHGSRTSLARPRFTDSISTDHAKCQDGCARSTRTQSQVRSFEPNEYVNYSKSTLVLMAKDRGVSHRGDIPDIV